MPFALLILILLTAAPTERVHAQLPVDSTVHPATVAPLVPLVGQDADGWRVEQIRGRASTGGFLLRSPSSGPPLGESPDFRWALVPPELDYVWNSEIPFSFNNGALWAGRGHNLLLGGGARLEWGPVTAIVAPQATYSQNLPFQIFTRDRPGQSQFASPWHSGPQWADLPLRFGDRPMAALHPGQSSLFVTTGAVSFGAATENNWWGPGAHTAIVLSSHAPGFPHLFLRTAAPIPTAIGDFEGRWLAGGLTESLFFDADPANDVRSFSGIAATFRPAAEPNLTIGVSRVVYGTAESAAHVLGSAFDAYTWWRQPPHRIPTLPKEEEEEEEIPVLPGDPGKEQMLALFARWILPVDGFEVYAEWARTELPRSIVEAANQPTHSQGYTLGFQWVTPVLDGGLARIHAEASYLEESHTFDNRPTRSYYASHVVPQGYTHLGQVVGAATGPGSSSQWLVAEYLNTEWRMGFLAGRVRWENDVYLRQPGRREAGHDVSLFAGPRAGIRWGGSDFALELLGGFRFNYLFQNPELEPDGTHALDVYNLTLRFTVKPDQVIRR